MSDDARLRQAYDELLAARKPADRAGCPTPEELLQLVEREGDESARMATLDHVLGCAWCRPELDALRASADAASAVTPESSRANRPSLGVSFRTLAMAAGIIVVAGVGLLARERGQPDSGTLRGSASAMTLATPERHANGDVVLRWSRPSDAVRYRVELFTTSGATVVETVVTDTSYVVRHDSAGGEHGPLEWMVTAIRADGAERASPVGRIAP